MLTIVRHRSDTIIFFLFQDEWQASLVFLVPGQAGAEVHIKSLIDSANGGNRKKFHVIDKEGLKQMVNQM